MSASQQTILGLLCVPCGARQQMAFMPSLCRTKHNRAKPMSELASALFSIADANEFRFARYYIVCEEGPLGTPESPPIVSGVSDMHPSDCPNVEETRNPMQTFSRKKCSHFSPTNFHLHSIRNRRTWSFSHITSLIKRGLSDTSGQPLLFCGQKRNCRNKHRSFG